MYFKKPLAVLTATAMTISGTAMTSTCFASVDAASEFNAAMETALDNSLESFSEKYNLAVSRFSDFSENGEHAELSIELGEGGAALIGLLGIDSSWIKDISLTIDEKITSDVLSIVLGISMNDTSLFTVNVPIDLVNMISYIQFPEISDSYIAAPISAHINGTPITLQELIANAKSLLPDEATLTSLIGRYGKLIINGLKNVTAENKSMFEGDSQQDCTVYTINISENDALAITRDLLTTAQQDEELEEIITQLGDALPSELETNGSQLHQAMINGIADILSQIEESSENTTEDTAFTLEISLDKDQNLARASIYPTGLEQPIFYFENSKKEDNTHINIGINSAEGQTVSIIGDGTTIDGVTNGDYRLLLTQDDQEITILDIGVVDHYNNVELQETHGEYTIQLNSDFLSTISSSEQLDTATLMAANMLSSYALVFIEDVTSDAVSTSITIKNDQQVLGTFYQHIIYSAEKEAELPGASDVVIDITDSNQLNEFLNSINPETIIAILENAGVPEEYLSSLRGDFAE